MNLFCSVNGLVVVTNYDPPHVADAYLQETISVNLTSLIVVGLAS